MWVISLICTYSLFGLTYGLRHVGQILKTLNEAGEFEKFLREMVAMYELTPKGAEYYSQLQDLHVSKSEVLAEYKTMKQHETRYTLQVFFMGFILWPYYIFSINQKKIVMKREWRR